MDSMERAIADIAAGKMVIVVDDEDRENEGDLVMAAEHATPEAVNFITRYARGILCASLPGREAERLGLPPMTQRNTARMGTPFTVSVDAAEGTTTGVSAADRSHTLRKLADPASVPGDFAMPGHIFPLRAAEGGVLRRAGHTEAAVDLAGLAGLREVGVLCEILNEDGSMARLPDLEAFAEEHGLTLISIADLIAYRRGRETLVERLAETELPTENGNWRMILFAGKPHNDLHVALVMGDPATFADADILVRVHSQCLTGDIFGSRRCDCGEQLDLAMARIAKEGRGVLLYMRQEGRGIGLLNKLRAYNLQDGGADTVDANVKLGFRPDQRDYGVGAQILADLGVRRMRIMTNNPAKRIGLESHGLTVVDRVSISVEPREENRRYLDTKREKMGHLLPTYEEEVSDHEV
ncbi:MAG: bifunctional 3,4-dihydroxy-2-butanone-4-phosphate synthase/GTP cyclohydrolase II [Gemmatimonadota bacterium]|jgi:3,4-dihydroxy 2-butanone 4-phosphate synthase/GTP cyclohydrolase II|nr:bifunctional 3,4-dihydroxy-2-butanone-4-phosphate synthase/GTP cyclohydrolase II [Gemmatimonadota bacterium]MDP6802754.1 bifunctional 3,4-dihydroxy-2-butanone-4-phosphate synthase/GTP cyclohydrolase II [Gemmatimonadota bacterium]MDP7031725.1 bifunctional 3,4-dihydroxy-2-butanone-4-phosphate synthase/GTP cyclohydrolase II [Gemmatimonadota bacterium]